MNRRQRADALRAELGITEEHPRFAGRYAREDPLCTPLEMKLLRTALRLTYRQFAAHFGVTAGQVIGWMRSDERRTELRVAPAVAKRLRPALTRAREMQLLRWEGPRPAPRKQTLTHRCAACGDDLLGRVVRKERAPGTGFGLYHLVAGIRCGPVQFATPLLVRAPVAPTPSVW